MSYGRFIIRRLSYELLKPSTIKQIIEKMYTNAVQTETIKGYCKLDDNQVTEIAEHLFKTVLGHPRALLERFCRCHSYDELVAGSPNSGDWCTFAEILLHYENPLRRMMNYVLDVEDNSFDLSGDSVDCEGNGTTYASIADTFGIGWDGTVDNAKLYMTPSIQHVILASFYPLKQLLEKLPPALDQISIDSPDVFELFLSARFRELIVEGKCPQDELPSIFTDQQKFGFYTTKKNAESTCWTPKVMKRGNQSRLVVTATADPDKMYVLMNDMSCLFHGSTPPPIESPAILLMAMVQDTKLSVGIAVKNCLTTKKVVDIECERFNSLHWVFKDRQYILIMCLTAYSAELNSEFNATDSEGHFTSLKSIVYPSRA